MVRDNPKIHKNYEIADSIALFSLLFKIELRRSFIPLFLPKLGNLNLFVLSVCLSPIEATYTSPNTCVFVCPFRIYGLSERNSILIIRPTYYLWFRYLNQGNFFGPMAPLCKLKQAWNLCPTFKKYYDMNKSHSQHSNSTFKLHTYLMLPPLLFTSLLCQDKLLKTRE